nr:hypothetical protein [Candidatus Sigynarchaeum springense]
MKKTTEHGLSKEDYMTLYPQFNRQCTICGNWFNALHLGRKQRVTCSPACSAEHTKRVQRENTKKYVKSEKYKAYKKKYNEKMTRLRRRHRRGLV